MTQQAQVTVKVECVEKALQSEAFLALKDGTLTLEKVREAGLCYMDGNSDLIAFGSLIETLIIINECGTELIESLSIPQDQLKYIAQMAK